MSAPSRCMGAERPLAAIDRLSARARTGAFLFETGRLDLQAAVDALQAFAERTGLLRELGQDLVQQVIAGAFEHIEREAPYA